MGSLIGAASYSITIWGTKLAAHILMVIALWTAENCITGIKDGKERSEEKRGSKMKKTKGESMERKKEREQEQEQMSYYCYQKQVA